jgi:hypothetical protein
MGLHRSQEPKEDEGAYRPDGQEPGSTRLPSLLSAQAGTVLGPFSAGIMHDCELVAPQPALAFIGADVLTFR